MKAKLSASSLIKNHYLIVRDKGVKFCDLSVRRFKFEEILCVLMSADNKLSFQVGLEVFSIPTKPNNPKHQKAIAALLEAVQGST
jgi:hypothetical protein